MIKKLIPLAIVGLLLAAVAVQLIFQATEEEPQAQATPVRTGTPYIGDLQVELSYNGNLRPEQSTVVTPLISGEILEILVEENQRVEKDQLLVRLDDEVVRLQAEQARANWEAAEAVLAKSVQGVRPEELQNARATLQQAENELQTARNNLARTENLFESGTIARAEYEEAQNRVTAAETELENARRNVQLMEQGARQEDINVARAQARAAQRQYDLAQLQLENARVLSPVAGRVVEIYNDAGNTAAPGNPLLSIVSDNVIYAKITIPEQHYGLFQQQRDSIRARVSPIAYPDSPPFEGFITSIAEVIQAESRTFVVDVAVENPASLLKPGMFVRVDFIVQEIRDVLLVPDTALVFREGSQVIFTLDNNEDGDPNTFIARSREVETGLSESGVTAIQSELNPNDRIIVEGNAFLEEGQEVRTIAGEGAE